MAQQRHMEVQLCREMHWTLKDLLETDEEFVWDCMTILGHEGAKMKREMDTRGGTRQRRPL